MRSKWTGVKKKLKDWDVDIVLITLVVLCLLLNAISIMTSEGKVRESRQVTTELLSI
ncbi:MAG: hypothetical protein AAGA02_09955 [Bacteroidota bacterium]